jgi:hypothetical protein
LKRIVCLGLWIASGSCSPATAANQQKEARSLEMLFADQSSAEFSAADRQQEIDLSIDGCRFALRNEQRPPHHSLQKPYAEHSVFNLALLSTRTDQVVKKPNKLTTFVSWHTTPEVFRSSFQMAERLFEAGKNARQELDRSDNREKNDSDRLQALADMSQRVWHDALAGPDGEFLRGNHQIKEAADRKLDPRRTFMPFLGFGLHLKPDAVADVIAALDLYKESYCSP